MSKSSNRNRFTKENRVIAKDIAQSLGKLPPQALDLEEAVLGAAMLERVGLLQIIDILKAEDFYLETHQIIYQAMVGLFRLDRPVDMRTVVDQLRVDGRIELVGGPYTIAQLTSRVSSAANIEYHARVIMEMAIKRKIITLASTMHYEAYEDTTDVFVVLDNVQHGFDEIAGLFLSGNVKPIKQVFAETTKILLEAKNQKGLTGVPSGYTVLDRLTAGWQKTELVIIAARPGMGKTAFVVNCLRNAAVDFKIPTAIFSLEMSALQLMQRMISAESEIELEKIIHGTYTDLELTRISNMTGRLAASPIFIDDTAALSILELRAKCRRLKAEFNIQLIVVDYLQLMRGDEDAGNREQEISSISRALKGIAKDLNVPVIALSQLSRGVETRGGDKRPQLSDLRESGAIEQDADKVVFLYRAEYYKITVYEDGSPTQGVMEAIVAKNRNGVCDTCQVRFVGKFSKVTDFTSDQNQLFLGAPQGVPAGFVPLNKRESYKDFQISRNEHTFGDEDQPPEPPKRSDDETPF